MLITSPIECSLFSLPPEDFPPIFTKLGNAQTSKLEGRLERKDAWSGLVTELTRHMEQVRNNLADRPVEPV